MRSRCFRVFITLAFALPCHGGSIIRKNVEREVAGFQKMLHAATATIDANGEVEQTIVLELPTGWEPQRGPKTRKDPKGAKCTMEKGRHHCNVGTRNGASCAYLNSFQPSKATTKSYIPDQLVVTGFPEKFSLVEPSLQDNILSILHKDPHIKLRWLGDDECSKYVWRYFANSSLGSHYDNEPVGAFRGDICRAAVLFREGGYYLDQEVHLRVPLSKLVDKRTSFMTSFSNANGKSRVKQLGSMLNAMMAAEPRSPVLASTLFEIDAWYKGDPRLPWGHMGKEFQMGPVTLWHGIDRAMECMCHRTDNLDKLWVHAIRKKALLQWPCGNRHLRVYIEKPLPDCHPEPNSNSTYSEECPEARARSKFEGVKYGIYDPSEEGALVAWPRLPNCTKWGCSTGGHAATPLVKDDPKAAQLLALRKKGPKEMQRLLKEEKRHKEHNEAVQRYLKSEQGHNSPSKSPTAAAMEISKDGTLQVQKPLQ